MPWSIFDLSCVAPKGMKLSYHRLNAGDLGLTFGESRRLATIRQIALAEMALKRMPLGKWLDDQEQRRGKHYRVLGDARQIELRGDEVGSLGCVGRCAAAAGSFCRFHAARACDGRPARQIAQSLDHRAGLGRSAGCAVCPVFAPLPVRRERVG